MPGQALPKMPVSKHGKFFGYADAKQIARSRGVLEVFDAGKAAVMEQEAKVKAQADADAKAAELAQASSGKAADPADVKKGPASK